jgi:glycosyltransferase involved in cell wall biosynthesis
MPPGQGAPVTFALICYNQARYIRDAVRAALAQDYHPLEILISDDHSSDGTFERIQEELASYRGPHTVRLLRNDQNVGFENWARTAEAARGEFVVGAHGDDISLPHRTRILVDAWRETNASIVSSNAEFIDADTRSLGLLQPDGDAVRLTATDFAKTGYSPFADGPNLAWHRDVFDQFRRLDESRLRGAYDHVLPFRGGLLNGVYYVPQSLLLRRLHGANLGLESEDRTKGSSEQKETRLAYNLSARICMLDDLDHWMAQLANQHQRIELRELLVAEILSLVRRWATLRNSLLAEAKQPTWLGRAEREQHPNYAQGYALSRSSARKATTRSILAMVSRLLKPLKRFQQ